MTFSKRKEQAMHIKELYSMKEKEAPSIKPVKALIIGLFVFIAIVFINLISNGNLSEVAEMQQRLEYMDNKIDGLRNENKQLKRKILSIEKDDFMVEKVAREELGLVKDDEVVYKTYDSQ
ncbi:MAG: septum formation initiator family protein [Nitrospinae bacterium]|nr:septum formation initiator family protein [Nitrospinota bacterium]